MYKSFALLAAAILILGTTGCGACRGLFNKSRAVVATPVYSQCAPSCQPTCCPSCGSSDSCGCNSGTPVTYGYGDGEMIFEPGASYEGVLPSGNTTFGE